MKNAPYELNGLIHAKYKSQSQMADKMGWSRQRLNKIVTGRKEPDLDEVNAIANQLGESFERIARIFLP